MKGCKKEFEDVQARMFDLQALQQVASPQWLDQKRNSCTRKHLEGPKDLRGLPTCGISRPTDEIHTGWANLNTQRHESTLHKYKPQPGAVRRGTPASGRTRRAGPPPAAGSPPPGWPPAPPAGHFPARGADCESTNWENGVGIVW